MRRIVGSHWTRLPEGSCCVPWACRNGSSKGGRSRLAFLVPHGLSRRVSLLSRESRTFALLKLAIPLFSFLQVLALGVKSLTLDEVASVWLKYELREIAQLSKVLHEASLLALKIGRCDAVPQIRQIQVRLLTLHAFCRRLLLTDDLACRCSDVPPLRHLPLPLRTRLLRNLRRPPLVKRDQYSPMALPRSTLFSIKVA